MATCFVVRRAGASLQPAVYNKVQTGLRANTIPANGYQHRQSGAEISRGLSKLDGRLEEAREKGAVGARMIKGSTQVGQVNVANLCDRQASPVFVAAASEG